MDNTNQSIIRVSSEIKVCEKCRNQVLPIVYGYPTPETFEKAARGEIILGGCCIDGPIEELEDLVCVKCGQRYKVVEINDKDLISRIQDIFEKSGIEGKVILMEPILTDNNDEQSDINLLTILYQDETSYNQEQEIRIPLTELEVETGKVISLKIVSLKEWEKLVENKSFFAELKNFKEILYEMVGSRKALDEAIEDIKNGNVSSATSVDEMIKSILNEPDED